MHKIEFNYLEEKIEFILRQISNILITNVSEKERTLMISAIISSSVCAIHQTRIRNKVSSSLPPNLYAHIGRHYLVQCTSFARAINKEVNKLNASSAAGKNKTEALRLYDIETEILIANAASDLTADLVAIYENPENVFN